MTIAVFSGCDAALDISPESVSMPAERNNVVSAATNGWLQWDEDAGAACDNSSKLTLCDTDNGSSWPESYTDEDSTFTVTLKFSRKAMLAPHAINRIFRVTNGRIVHVRTRGDSSSVTLWTGHSRQRAKIWELTVRPTRLQRNVKLFYPKRGCKELLVICTNRKTPQNNDKDNVYQALDHRIRIVIPWEKIEIKQAPTTKPSKLPGAVRDVSLGSYIVRWTAPSTHGASFITEYRVFNRSCDGYRLKTLHHPDDFWQHGGSDRRLSVRLGIRPQSVGVQAVNSYGSGECTES